MSNDYQSVSRALADGADPAMLCMTCPWDRNCITPPSMTRAEIDAQMKEAQRKDEARQAELRAQGKDPGMPTGMLLTALTIGARDTQASVCPVFAMRMKLPEGRQIGDLVKGHMQSAERDGGA